MNKLILVILSILVLSSCDRGKDKLPVTKKKEIVFHTPANIDKLLPKWRGKLRQGGMENDCDVIGEICSKLILIPEKNPRQSKSYNLEIEVKIREIMGGDEVVIKKVPGFRHRLIKTEGRSHGSGNIIYLNIKHPKENCPGCLDIQKKINKADSV